MGFKMPHVLTLVAIACAVLGTVLQAVAVATTGWMVGDVRYRSMTVTVSTGLFQQCASFACEDFKASHPWLDACRAFGILAILALAGCAVIGLLSCCIQNKRMVVFVAIFLGFGGGLCCIIELAVYIGKTTNVTGMNYSYSFALSIVAGVAGFAAGVFHFLSITRTSG